MPPPRNVPPHTGLDRLMGKPEEVMVLKDTPSGHAVIPADTPLARLNYYDGKFLKASDFALEQRYLRKLVALSNQGLGTGVVYGFDTTLHGERGSELLIGPGLAMDPDGYTLYLNRAAKLDLGKLVEATVARRSTRTDATGKKTSAAFTECIEVAAPEEVAALPAGNLFVIALCRAEALCGMEDVYGKLCEDACVTSTDRPLLREGVVVRAIPLHLTSPAPTSRVISLADERTYLRSIVASRYYADQVLRQPSALSRDGLLTTLWCHGAGYDLSCCEVPLAVVARSGSETLFLDAWTVRRERLEAPARRYWQWKMRMRPLDVFLAQVLQFQCQLAETLGATRSGGFADPCKPADDVLGDAAAFLGLLDDEARTRNELPNRISFEHLGQLRRKIDEVLKLKKTALGQLSSRVLIHGGIIELPPAGYLPIEKDATRSVNQQVRALLGDGLDYRFCVVTPDYPAHALEAAQHMDRISLLRGLDDPANKPKVDILVPDGRVISRDAAPSEGLFSATLKGDVQDLGWWDYAGVGREEQLDSGGKVLYAALAGVSESVVRRFATLMQPVVSAARLGGGRRARIDPRLNMLRGNLDTSRRVDRASDVLPPRFTMAVDGVARLARMGPVRRTAVAGEVAEVAPTALYDSRVLLEREAVDGVWMTWRCEERIADLTVNDQAPFSARLVWGEVRSLAISLEAEVAGTLTLTHVRQGSPGGRTVVRAEASPVVSFTVGVDRPAEELEYAGVVTRKMDLELEFSFQGNDPVGSVVLDVFDEEDPNTPRRPVFRVERKASGGPEAAKITFFSTSTTDANPPVVTFDAMAELTLRPDPDVTRFGNPNHDRAVDALDVMQMTRLTTEPNFKKVYEPLLFPEVARKASELVIQATQDWVLFHKRREKHCTDALPEPEVRPPRRYRVYELTVGSLEEGQSVLRTLRDPARLAELLRKLDESRREPEMTVSFAGGRTVPLFDAADAAADFKRFSPGTKILSVVYGSIDDNSESLQSGRLAQLEDALPTISKADSDTERVPLVPFPTQAQPPDAEGLFFFVTISGTECLEVIHFPIQRTDNGAIDDRPWTAMVAALNANGSQADVDNILARAQARSLGEAQYAEGTTTVTNGIVADLGGTLTSANAQVLRVCTWGAKTDESLARRFEQGEELRRQLGTLVAASAPPTDNVSTSAFAPRTQVANAMNHCPAIVFVGVAPERNTVEPVRVLAVLGRSGNRDVVIRAFPRTNLARAVAEVTGDSVTQRISPDEFTTSNGPVQRIIVWTRRDEPGARTRFELLARHLKDDVGQAIADSAITRVEIDELTAERIDQLRAVGVSEAEDVDEVALLFAQ